MSSDDVVRVERRVDAPPAVVFSYLTSSERWSLWQGVATTIDPRPGGAYEMIAPNGGRALGEILEIVENELVSFTWGWEGHPTVPPGSTTVTIELRDEEGRTLVVLTHRGLPRDEMGLHHLGWGHYVTRLTGISEGLDVGEDTGLDSA